MGEWHKWEFGWKRTIPYGRENLVLEVDYPKKKYRGKRCADYIVTVETFDEVITLASGTCDDLASAKRAAVKAARKMLTEALAALDETGKESE